MTQPFMPVKITASKYEQMIARRGRDVKWEQAILCSCWNMDSGQPQYDCQACLGKGYTYEDPVYERVLVMSITQNKEFEETAGVFEIGDAVMTVPKLVFSLYLDPQNFSGVPSYKYERESLLYEVGMYDLITLLDDDYKTSEVLVKGTPIYRRPADTLLNPDVVEIITVRMSDPETGVVTKFTPGTDYTLVGNTVVWAEPSEETRQPSEGAQYSVTYKFRPVFTVLTNLPKPRHQDGQDLPRYVALRLRAGGFEPK